MVVSLNFHFMVNEIWELKCEFPDNELLIMYYFLVLLLCSDSNSICRNL